MSKHRCLRDKCAECVERDTVAENDRFRVENARLRGALRAVPLPDHTIDALADGSADGWIDMDDVQHTVAVL